MQYSDDFANIIKELRSKTGLSQSQLAEQMAVSRSAVSMWELGSRLPDINMLGRLADCLGVERRVLLDAVQGGTGGTVNVLVVEDIPALLHGAVREGAGVLSIPSLPRRGTANRPVAPCQGRRMVTLPRHGNRRNRHDPASRSPAPHEDALYCSSGYTQRFQL